MNLKNLDLLIDKNLALLSSKDEHSEFYIHFLNEKGEEYWKIGKEYEAERLTKIMLDKELIILTKELAVLTELGFQVIQKGGWIKYSEKVKEDSLAEEEFLKKRDRIDYKLKKWQSKTFWPIFFIAIIGFSISIYNLYRNNKSSKKVESYKEKFQQLNYEINEVKESFMNKKKDTIDIKFNPKN